MKAFLFGYRVDISAQQLEEFFRFPVISERHMVCLHLVLSKAARIRSMQSEVKDIWGASLKETFQQELVGNLICRIKVGWMWLGNE